MSYSINAKDITKATGFLRGAVRAVEKAQMRAINRTASKTRTAASKAIRQDIKLPASYVNENLKVSRKASINNPEAVITGRKRPTRLARYGAKQMSRVAKQASGDPSRGIASGRKQAGVSVAVKKGGSRKKMRKAFLIPLKGSNAMGVFVRTGSGKKDIKHLYGPSVDQVFRAVRTDLKPQIRRELVTEYERQLANALRQELKK